MSPTFFWSLTKGMLIQFNSRSIKSFGDSLTKFSFLILDKLKFERLPSLLKKIGLFSSFSQIIAMPSKATPVLRISLTRVPVFSSWS